MLHQVFGFGPDPRAWNLITLDLKCIVRPDAAGAMQPKNNGILLRVVIVRRNEQAVWDRPSRMAVLPRNKPVHFAGRLIARTHCHEQDQDCRPLHDIALSRKPPLISSTGLVLSHRLAARSHSPS